MEQGAGLYAQASALVAGLFNHRHLGMGNGLCDETSVLIVKQWIVRPTRHQSRYRDGSRQFGNIRMLNSTPSH